MRLKARKNSVVCAVIALLASATGAAALEERFEDLSASVEVAGVFGVDVTQTSLTFTNVSQNKTTILGEGSFYNQVKCRSNYGRRWYLKAQLIELRHTSTNRTLPVSALKWKIVGSTGSGQPSGSRGDFQAFSQEPSVIYESQGDDNRGREVALQFQYSLTPPSSSLAGTYVGQIIFTMVEAP